MTNNQKIFLECYKTSISVDLYGIDAPLEGLTVTLCEVITKKVFLYNNEKMQNLIISVEWGIYGMGKGNVVVTWAYIKDKETVGFIKCTGKYL